MDIAWQKILPVIVSIIIIITIAVLREYSKTLAAIASTMPINIPLGMWIIAAGDSSAGVMQQFMGALFINIWPTIGFLMVAWLAARAGWGLVPMIAAGYIAWGIGLGV
ncbi:MAG: hypothetical protein K8I30_04845, partial [Anaerolineae bacterium]|nr:hypothetical protein [Anaerolineae bacterium]